jgi:hypothetical protein
LKLCEPDTKECSIIEYLNPIEMNDNNLNETILDEHKEEPVLSKRTKLNIENLSDIIVRAKTDIPPFKVWAGDIPSLYKLDEIDYYDDYSDDDFDEYSESGFTAEEEMLMNINEMVDEPISIDLNGVSPSSEGGSYDTSQNFGTEFSNVNPGRLVNDKRTMMVNLAGHRLTKVLSSLQEFLNNNGFPGTVIKSNGVMRDLKSSAYPNSPKRAAASFHGCGLAIDVIFQIPGYVWKGIGDNGNLAKNSTLNKTIARYVKQQGDLTWGGVWGGSKPDDGIVKGHGITEYHHFEIRKDYISKYWEPYKDELSKYNLKPTDLTNCGRNTKLHNLMMTLMG